MLKVKFNLRLFFALLGITFLLSAPIWAQQQRPNAPLTEEEKNEKSENAMRSGLLDDSTKMVYGPKTSLYFYEKFVKNNKFKKLELDTSLTGFHNYEPVANTWYKYQDLGNLGTAARPIFYDVPVQIGRTSGFHAYDLYHNSPDSIKYYDTKSPHTKIEAFFGGGNRNKLDVEFTRNIKPNWNVGIAYHTIRATKTLNPTTRDDHNVVNDSYEIFTNYKSENGKYFLLANITRMKHKVDEQGGIIPPDVDTTSLYFTYEDAKVWLSNSQAVDLRQNYHLYHEYEILKGWQAYHVFDKAKQAVTFVADLETSDADFFNENRFNSDNEDHPYSIEETTNNHSHFSEWKNEFGFKGDFGPVYYNAFLKFRTGRMASRFFTSNNSFNELSLGGALRGEINENWVFEAEGEYLIPDGYRVKGLFKSPFLDVSYTKALYKPNMMQQQYSGNHYKWDNDFESTGVDQIKGTLKGDFKNYKIRPNITINRVNNYIFYNQEMVPEQISEEAFMVIPGLETHLVFAGKFHWQSEAYYTLITGGAADKFRIPELFVNTRIFFDGPLFDDHVYVQLGVEGRYRSDNYAPAYMPATQQFYLQDNFNVYAYPVADAFLNFRINRTRVLFRYNHLNAGQMSNEGYFVTPDFTGLKGTLDLGISWYFFD
ncbi:MAG: putative porin [Cytophagales bacterium]|uniref:putative porin n=1 Tax=Cyclobacterium marinum TaxID=104 RepID=UPI0030DC815B|nr:putative porin [Cytophagales bacterium]|tara:strand:+ start:41631 stop:43589 length:1959 start_codon:yes stop_codon:yes gene_type:complete